MSDAWKDEGFGGENDWGEESVETDVEEEDGLFDSLEVDQEDDDFDADDEQ